MGAGSGAPPASLRAVVRAALGTLPEPARALAEAVAAAGRGLAAPEIAALPATVEAERQLLDTGLARRASGGLAYRHALLADVDAEVLYRRLVGTQRAPCLLAVNKVDRRADKSVLLPFALQ